MWKGGPVFDKSGPRCSVALATDKRRSPQCVNALNNHLLPLEMEGDSAEETF